MKYIISPIVTFMFLVFIIAFIFIFGFMIGISAEMHNTQFITEKVQDQFWEIQELELELQRCEYNAGNIQEIVLPIYTTG